MENTALENIGKSLLFPLEEKETIYVKEGKYLAYRTEKEKRFRKVFQFVMNGAPAWYDKEEDFTIITIEKVEIKQENGTININQKVLKTIPIKKYNLTAEETKKEIDKFIKSQNISITQKKISGKELVKEYTEYMESKNGIHSQMQHGKSKQTIPE